MWSPFYTFIVIALCITSYSTQICKHNQVIKMRIRSKSADVWCEHMKNVSMKTPECIFFFPFECDGIQKFYRFDWHKETNIYFPKPAIKHHTKHISKLCDKFRCMAASKLFVDMYGLNWTHAWYAFELLQHLVRSDRGMVKWCSRSQIVFNVSHLKIAFPWHSQRFTTSGRI